jgi:LuxR family maltose regulon positive regulatory protein
VDRPAPDVAPLLEPVRTREIEILRLVAAGYSNQAIAEQLVISVGTVRWHLKNIYGKLDVHSRTGAVARGRALRLLD